jgi:hypothetical protein
MQNENPNKFLDKADRDKTYPVEMRKHIATTESWLRDYCENGELIRIVVLQDGTRALLNVRTNNIFFMSRDL